MGAADRPRTRLRQTKVANLTLLDQLFHGACNVCHRHFGIDKMLVEQIDVIGLQASQAAIHSRPDMGRLTVDAALVHARIGVDVPTELGSNLHLIAERQESLAHHLLVRQWTVGLGGVEEVDAALDRFADEADHLGPILKFPGFAIAHAAQRESRYFETAVAELSLLHHTLLEFTGRA